MDDAALVAEARAGSKDAFAAIYDRYARRLHDFLCNVLRDPDDAADVLHDTFLAAGSRLHQLRDPAKLRPWLYAIARHRALGLLRQRSRVEPVERVEVTVAGPETPEEVAVRGEVVELVRAAAAGLSARDRVVLDLHMRQGLEGRELGEALGVSTGQAYVLVSRLRDQVERALGALLVARQGRRDCDGLAALLRGWDGRFTALWRKRVARHIDGCTACGDLRRRTVSPTALLAAVPAVALPAALRDRVLGDVRLVSHRGRPWPARPGGFPPPMVSTRRPPLGAFAGAVVALVLLLGGAYVISGDRPSGQEVVGAAPVATTAAPSAPGRPETPEATTATSPTTTRAPSRPPATASPPPPATIDPPAATTALPTTPPPTTPTTSTTSMTQPPAPVLSLGLLRVDPAEVWTGEACGASRPQQATVTVVAGNPSGPVAVTLEWGGPEPGSAPMTAAGGGVHAAVVGPFEEYAVPPGVLIEIPLTARATDAAGTEASSTGSLVLSCVPTPP